MSIAIKDNPNLTLDSIHPSVWQPCLGKCKQLLASLSDLSMKLLDVDQVFRDHRENIDPQLCALFKGMSLCAREQYDWRQIEKAIGKIKQYWDLCRYRKGANIFLGIRDSLGLEGGDFSLVEKLSKEVSLVISQYSNSLSPFFSFYLSDSWLPLEETRLLAMLMRALCKQECSWKILQRIRERWTAWIHLQSVKILFSGSKRKRKVRCTVFLGFLCCG